MSHSLAVPLKHFAGLALLVAGAAVIAADPAAAPVGPMLLAGEIILVPPKADTSSGATEAGRQREMAREYRKGQTAAPPAVIVVPDEEAGVLAPRPGMSGAAENAAKARAYRQGDNGVTFVPAPVVQESPQAGSETPAAQSARKNRARAIEYRKGEQHSTVSVKGADGLPVIDCSNVDNISGRIGDDTRSGSVVILVQDRNQVKVRCR